MLQSSENLLPIVWSRQASSLKVQGGAYKERWSHSDKANVWFLVWQGRVESTSIICSWTSLQFEYQLASYQLLDFAQFYYYYFFIIFNFDYLLYLNPKLFFNKTIFLLSNGFKFYHLF